MLCAACFKSTQRLAIGPISPAKNVIPNPATTTSGQGTMGRVSEVSWSPTSSAFFINYGYVYDCVSKHLQMYRGLPAKNAIPNQDWITSVIATTVRTWDA